MTETATREMPLYRSHKIVRALEIFHVDVPRDARGEFRLVSFAEDGYQSMALPEAMFTRYMPVSGDYLVQYEDGYRSFSPRKAFLDGYTRIDGDKA